MVAPETRVMVKVPLNEEVLEEVKVEVLRLSGESCQAYRRTET